MDWENYIPDIDKHIHNLSFLEKIYIIESPRDEELLIGRNEGDALRQVLSLADIEVVYFLAVNEEMFEKAFDDISSLIANQIDLNTAMPFIHISAHGLEDGIELTDGQILDWQKLNRLLSGLHMKIGPAVMPQPLPQNIPKTSICLSSCGVFDPFVENTKTNPTYQSVVGPSSDVGWCEALLAFSTFYYHACVLKTSFDVAVQSMNIASGALLSGKPKFFFLNPHETSLTSPQ